MGFQTNTVCGVRREAARSGINCRCQPFFFDKNETFFAVLQKMETPFATLPSLFAKRESLFAPLPLPPAIRALCFAIWEAPLAGLSTSAATLPALPAKREAVPATLPIPGDKSTSAPRKTGSGSRNLADPWRQFGRRSGQMGSGSCNLVHPWRHSGRRSPQNGRQLLQACRTMAASGHHPSQNGKQLSQGCSMSPAVGRWSFQVNGR